MPAVLSGEADEGGRILGFYSLNPASVAFDRTPELVEHGLARHDVPVFRLARLAVDRSVQGILLEDWVGVK